MAFKLNIPNYQTWREKAVIACKNPWEHHFFPIGDTGPQGETLGIDVFLKTITTNAPWVVHVSGTHGTEGYIGSDIQTEILSNPEFTTVNANILLVHALNSYGMAWYRRANRKNVDLNRNSIKHGVEKLPWPQEFVDLHFVGPSLDGAKKLWNALNAICRIGLKKSINTFASGQSEYPEAIFYTGKEIQKETQLFKDILGQFIKSPSKIYFIDVHSGLGPFGIETLFSDDQKGVYDSKGLLSLSVRDAFPNTAIHAVVEEFGTYPMGKMLWVLLKENFHFLNRKNQELDIALAKLQIDHLYPLEKNWRHICREKGVAFFKKIISESTQ